MLETPQANSSLTQKVLNVDDYLIDFFIILSYSSKRKGNRLAVRDLISKIDHAVERVFPSALHEIRQLSQPLLIKRTDDLNQLLRLKILKAVQLSRSVAGDRARGSTPTMLNRQLGNRSLDVSRHKNAKVSCKIRLDLWVDTL